MVPGWVAGVVKEAKQVRVALRVHVFELNGEVIPCVSGWRWHRVAHPAVRVEQRRLHRVRRDGLRRNARDLRLAEIPRPTRLAWGGGPRVVAPAPVGPLV